MSLYYEQFFHPSGVEYGTGKKVHCVTEYTVKYETLTYASSYHNSVLFFSEKPLDFDKLLKSKISTTLVGDSLYFTKNATFPKCKLQGTKYKRKIKPENASNLIIQDGLGARTILANCPLFIYETETDVYFIPAASYQPNWKEAVDAWMHKYRPDATYRNQSYGYVFDKNSAILMDIYTNIITQNIVTVNTLENIIGKTLPLPTEEEIDSIRDMLKSPDIDTRELGIKMILNFDYIHIPNLTRCLLLENSTVVNSDMKKSLVSFKSLLKNLDLRYRPTGIFWTKYIKLIDPTEFEIQQIKRILFPYYKEHIELLIREYTPEKFPGCPKMTITYE